MKQIITTLYFNVLEEVAVEYPVGHKRRREEGTPVLMKWYQTILSRVFDNEQRSKIEELTLDFYQIVKMRVDEVRDLLVKR